MYYVYCIISFFIVDRAGKCLFMAQVELEDFPKIER